ncbi:MAG TPA: response regulator [Levilinea sp.]|nr:response regulator [Levilinea sp.]
MVETRILLADDHEVVRAGIGNVLQDMAGIHVVGEVGDGGSLLAEIHNLQPDVVLMDITMPALDPFEAVQQMRALYPNLKILIVTAYDDDVYVQGMLRAGVNGYHLKDQPLSDLKLAIQRVLSGERWVSSPLITRLVGASQPRPGPTALLTARQRDLLRLLINGLDNNAMAREMGLSIKTVENHLTRLYKQLQVQSRLEAVSFINQHPEILGATGQERMQSQLEGNPVKGVGILVVDDNPRYLRQLQRVIGKVCPQAVLYEAESISVAVQLAQRIKPRLVLVDVVLGEEDGIRCVRRIKAVSQQSRIVMISAYPDREFHRLSLEAGAVAFLDKKDLDAITLRQVVEDVIA